MKNLKIAFRNLLKNKLVSIINLFGLTLGIVISVLLLSHVRQEKNTDKFIKDYENIYVFSQNEENTSNYMARPAVEQLRNRFTDIPITYTSDDWAGQVFLMDDAGNSFKVNHLLNTDSTFFNVFQFDAVAGNPQRALDVASQIVLKESFAKKIFGNQNPIGKTLRMSTSFFSNEPVEVSAVLKDFPKNSAWTFEAAVSTRLNDKAISGYKKNADRWGAQNYTAFCRLPSNIDPDNFHRQLDVFSQSPEITENAPYKMIFSIHPYSKLYLHTPKDARSAITLKKGNPQTLSVLQLIAVLMLLMACINYVNLVSAQRKKRNKSVAVIKMLGSQRWGVIKIFMAEAAMLLLAVVALSIVALPFVLQFFNKLMEANYTAALFASPENIALIAAILLITFLITGLLPGIIFSNYKALRLIKPIDGKQKESLFRNVLPVLQFSIAIGLIACLFVIKKQNDMMLSQNIGYQREHIIYAATNSDLRKQTQALKNDLKSVTGVSEITFADADFLNILQNWGVDFVYDGSKERTIGFAKIGVSPNFFDFFGIKFAQGQNFTKTEANYDEVIFNQTAIREFGISDLEKARIMDNGRVVGVVKDFNLKSAHYPIAPVGFMNDGSVAYIYLKTNTQNYDQLKTLIADIEQKWNKLSPNIPFEYHFLDQEWDNLYKKEVQFQALLSQAGWISIFIACLGLFGLSMFVTERRTKEIGIRKINGASIAEILGLLNKGFVKWIIVAFVIATPIAYFAMNKWLENFAYKTTLSWWIFALAGLASLLVALITVSWQSWRAASRNPVEALRYE